MRLKIKNIGMIEEADIKLDGLTVIAGENDTGKSTVSKVLYSIIKSFSKNYNLGVSNLQDNFHIYFASDIAKDAKISFETNSKKLDFEIVENRCAIIYSDFDSYGKNAPNNHPKIIMIETPLIWNMLDLFTKLPMIEDEMNIELEYPKIMKDLH